MSVGVRDIWLSYRVGMRNAPIGLFSRHVYALTKAELGDHSRLVGPSAL